jgi:MoxR-like ATPase
MVHRQLVRHPLDDLEPVISAEEVVRHQRAVRAVHVDSTVLDYVAALVEATRAHPDVALGASPRSMLALTSAAQARAVADGRAFVLPDDVKTLAGAVLAHRLIAKGSGRGVSAGRDVVRRILEEVPVPLGVAGRG